MKKSTFKRFLSLLMALSMVMSMMPMSAAATEGTDPEATEASGHTCSYTVESIVTNATCGVAGEKKLSCSVEGCEKFITESIAATGEHTYDEGTVTLEATCGAEGKKLFTCTVCNSTREEAIDATGNHTYNNGVCTVCNTPKPCTLAADCDANAHAEECLSQCDSTVNCDNKAHKEGCLSQVPCTCVSLCAETKACPVCEGEGQCKGGEAAERIAAVQALIDALPTQYKLSQLDAVQAQYNECTNAIGALKDHERAVLDMTKYYATAEVTDDVNVAEVVGGQKYPTLTEAFAAAAENGGTVKLLTDIPIEGTVDGVITIADGKSATLDLNGKTITVTDKASGNFSLFYIFGSMTMTDSASGGQIALTATSNRAWSAMSVIFHNRGGVLTINGGTYKHLGGTDMAFVVDNSGNYYGNATTNISGGTLSSTYTAIRNRMEQNSHGASGTAIMNVSGGTITGTTSAIWAQAASESTTSPATGEIKITGGTIGVINTARSAGAVCNTIISNGSVASVKAEKGEVKISGGQVGGLNILDASGNPVTYDSIITGGTFKNGDTVVDISSYLCLGYTQSATTGTVGTTTIESKPADDKTQVSVSTEISSSVPTEIKTNTSVDTNNAAESVKPAEVQSAVANIKDAAGATGVVISMKVEVTDYENTTEATVLTFDVAPHVQPIKEEGSTTVNVGSGVTLSTVEKPITFRLPMPNGTKGQTAKVQHQHGTGDAAFFGAYTINGTGEGAASTNCYIELESNLFSEWKVEILKDPASEVAGVPYATLEEALAMAENGDTILLKDDVLLTKQLILDKAITLDGDGHTIQVKADGFSDAFFNESSNNKFMVSVTANVTVKDVTLDANSKTKGIQFYCCDGVLDNVTIKNVKQWYGVHLNAANVTISTALNMIDCTNDNGGSAIALGYGSGITNKTVSLNIANGTDTSTVSGIAVQVGEHATGDEFSITLPADSELTIYADVEPVAKIGNTYYPTLNGAIVAADDGDIVELIKNVTLTDTVSVSNKVILDMENGDNKYTLSISDNTKPLFNVTADGELALTNGTFNGSLTVDTDGVLAISGGTFEASVNATDITGGTFKSTVSATNITGGTFKGAVTATGIISNGTFENTVTVNGAISNGTFKGTVNAVGTITGGSFENTVTGTGTGLTIKGGTFDKAVSGAVLYHGGTFKAAVTSSITASKPIPGTVPGATAGTTVPNPAQFAVKPSESLIENNYIAVKNSSDMYVIQKKASVIVDNNEYFYGTNETLDDVFEDNNSKSNFKLSRNEELKNIHTFTAATTTIDFNGKLIYGGGSVTASAGKSIYLNNIGPKEIDVVLGPGDKAVFGTDGTVTITAAESKNTSGQAVGYGEVLLTVQTTSNTPSPIMYYLGKDAALKINPNGSLTTSGQVITGSSTSTKPGYYITQVDNGSIITSSFVYGSSKTLTFSSNAFFEGFVKVTVNDKELLSTAYTAKAGSTIVTLSNSYLKTLNKGTHTLTMHFMDGQTASANFYVVSEAKPAWNPQTGDMIMTSVIVMAVAAAGLAALWFIGKKKKK